MSAPIPLALFADFASPYARVTEAAARRLEEAGEARVTPYAFELHPAPTPLPVEPEAVDRAALATIAAELGVRVDADAPPVRTRKALEAAALAEERGLGAAFRERVWEARFVERRDIGRVDVLVELAAEAGLDPGEVRVVLDVDRYSARVAGETAAAAAAGVRGVPTLVAGTGDGARWWTGAAGPATLLAWLRGRD